MPHITFEGVILAWLLCAGVIVSLGLIGGLFSLAFWVWAIRTGADAIRDRNRGDDR